MERKVEGKQPWMFNPNVSADNRGPIALEHIAHYLDRIEGHLEVIANAVRQGGVNDTLRIQLMNIERAIQTGNRKG